MNPEFITGWKCMGAPMTVPTIMAWADQWYTGECPQIPEFEIAERNRNVDIRVKFSSELTSIHFSYIVHDIV